MTNKLVSDKHVSLVLAPCTGIKKARQGIALLLTGSIGLAKSEIALYCFPDSLGDLEPHTELARRDWISLPRANGRKVIISVLVGRHRFSRKP